MQKKLLALFLFGLAAKAHEAIVNESGEILVVSQEDEPELKLETNDVVMIQTPRGFLRMNPDTPSEPFDPSAIVETLQDAVKGIQEPLTQKLGEMISWVTGDEQPNAEEREPEEQREERDEMEEKDLMDNNVEIEGTEERVDDAVEAIEEYNETEEKYEVEEKGKNEDPEEDEEGDQFNTRSFLRVPSSGNDEKMEIEEDDQLLEVRDDNEENDDDDQDDEPSYSGDVETKEEEEDQDDMGFYDDYGQDEGVDEKVLSPDGNVDRNDDEGVVTEEAMEEQENIVENDKAEVKGFMNRLFSMIVGNRNNDEENGSKKFYDGL